MKEDECQVHGLEEKVKGGLEDWNITNRMFRDGCVDYKIGTRIIL
jgi:hypothetical protein